MRGDERGTKAQRRRTVGPQGTGARQDPEGNGEVAASRDPARDSLPMGKEPRDRLRLQVSRSDAGGGVDGSVGVRVGAPLRFQGDLHTAEGDHKVTTLRNLDEDKLPATEKPRGVSCLQVSRDDTGGGTRRTRSFDVPHEEGMGPLGSGPPGLSADRMGDPYEGSMGPLGPGPPGLNAARVGERRDLPRAPEGPLRTPRQVSGDYETAGGVPKGNKTTIVHGKPHSQTHGDVAMPCFSTLRAQQVQTRISGPWLSGSHPSKAWGSPGTNPAKGGTGFDSKAAARESNGDKRRGRARGGHHHEGR